MFRALLVHRSLSVDFVSRDVSNWLFRLFWRLPRSYWNSKDYHNLTGIQKIKPKCSVLSLCTKFKCSVLSWGHRRSYWNSKDYHNLIGTQRIKPKCSVLSLCTAVFLVDLVSRDVSNWLFRLQRCFQLVISSLS